MTVLVFNILTENLVQIDDRIGKSGWISQEIGLLQGDPLSPDTVQLLHGRCGRKNQGWNQSEDIYTQITRPWQQRTKKNSKRPWS